MKTITIEFDEEEVFDILADYYGIEDDENFEFDTWTEQEIKTAIVNR